MKNIVRFIFVYLLFVGLIFSFYFKTNDEYEKQLSYTQQESAGVEYLKSIHQLSISLALYIEFIELEAKQSEMIDTKKRIYSEIDAIYLLRKKYPQFKNDELHRQLERLRNSTLESHEYYNFLDYINHENYRAGDISRLLFEQDRKVYFLGSLLTHYLPEYLISALVVHNKLEEFSRKGNLDKEAKNLYIEQNKLVYLSSDELYEIIGLLKPYDEMQNLSRMINESRDVLDKISKYSNRLPLHELDDKEIEDYLSLSYKLLDLAYDLNDENIRLLESSLKTRSDFLSEKILTNQLVLVLILILLTAIGFYFYHVHRSNIKKDSELLKINQTLDDLVVFSKTDRKGHITYVSTALEKLSGFSRDELIGKDFKLLAHEDMSETVFNDLWTKVLSKNTWEGEIKNKRKDNSSYWVKTTVIPDLDENEELIGFSAYTENISDHKALQQEKEKTQQALEFKSQFLSNMSHEIRTPLNGIIGFSYMALKTKLDARQKDIMNKIRSTSNILLGVINDILDISKIEAGKMDIENISFNLRDLIENLEGIFSEMANKKGISLITSYEDVSNFNFSGDERRISQILINLLNNAIKFTHKGVVHLRVKEIRNDLVQFEVQDTGIGLKEKEQKTLFKEFMQADMSISRHYGGTGLGLAISKKLVEMMDGKISVSSDFGVGSTFTFELPLTPIEVEGTEQAIQLDKDSLEEEVNGIRDVKILVAEDNKMNQMLLEMLLEESALLLDFAQDGQVALKKFKENDYDLVLMDIQMPYMNGYEATEEIRLIDADIPIIALSANVMQEDIDKAFTAGMNDWLAKPIEVEKLYAILLKYLA